MVCSIRFFKYDDSKVVLMKKQTVPGSEWILSDDTWKNWLSFTSKTPFSKGTSNCEKEIVFLTGKMDVLYISKW